MNNEDDHSIYRWIGRTRSLVADIFRILACSFQCIALNNLSIVLQRGVMRRV